VSGQLHGWAALSFERNSPRFLLDRKLSALQGCGSKEKILFPFRKSNDRGILALYILIHSELQLIIATEFHDFS
jgi:hypothetical protein